MTSLYTSQIDTPDGAFSIVTDESAVLASGWTEDVDLLISLVHPSLRGTAVDSEDPRVLAEAQEAVTVYYDGDHWAPMRVAVHQQSGPFRQHAWEVLREVEPGAPDTYAEYAARSGNPGAVRAAAGACAKNATALFVPCHRVIRTDGSLGGFRYGLRIKESLLKRESRS